MKTKYVFEKLFVRDTTLIVQQAGANAHHKGLFDIINIKNPFKYMTAHYLNDDVIEVWKVVKSLQWLKKKISECNLKTEKIKEVLKEQKILEKKFKEMLRKKPTLEEFKESLKIIFKLVTNSFFINYTALDNNLKGEKKELALKAREKDTIIDDTDKYIRKSITYMFPHLKGCENALLAKELDNPPKKEELIRRKKGFLMIYDEVYEITKLSEYEKKNKEITFKKTKYKQTNEIKGMTVMPGKAEGRVRILKKKDQIKDFKEGEILISPMTTPDFLPAMKKAAAIVTDEGSITCHAAIISREMKKPCIVGTKIATKIFKDGDYVEVDANKGIIKKL